MSMNTNHRTEKFISSQQMESSEIQKRAIKLGKALVKELDSQPGADTLSHWMAHHIAEKLTIAKKARGAAKIKAEQECFELILMLWEHRAHLPTGTRPFESFDPIFRALARLDPENKGPLFYRNQNSSGKDSSEEDSDDVLKWLSVARGIDRAARIWLEYVFHQAALSATNEDTILWLENAVSNSGKDEISIIIQLIDAELEDVEESGDQEIKARRDILESRIEQLDAFNDFNQIVREALEAKLKAINEGDTSPEDKIGNP